MVEKSKTFLYLLNFYFKIIVSILVVGITIQRNQAKFIRKATLQLPSNGRPWGLL